MSWEHPEPPVYAYWKGIAIIAGTVLAFGAFIYLIWG